MAATQTGSEQVVTTRDALGDFVPSQEGNRLGRTGFVWKTNPKSSRVSVEAAPALVFMPGWSLQEPRADKWVRASIRAAEPARLGPARAPGHQPRQERVPSSHPESRSEPPTEKQTVLSCPPQQSGVPCSAWGQGMNPQPDPALCTAPAAPGDPDPRLLMPSGLGRPTGTPAQSQDMNGFHRASSVEHWCAGAIRPQTPAKAPAAFPDDTVWGGDTGDISSLTQGCILPHLYEHGREGAKCCHPFSWAFSPYIRGFGGSFPPPPPGMVL